VDLTDIAIGITPEFAPGCRRITPGDPFIKAIQQPNVEVVFKSVRRLTNDGVVDADGVERKFDAVVCATGNVLPGSKLLSR
jgi:hydroxyversicolorone monooxygenase